MKLKFKPSPTPSFAFDGLQRTCIKFKTVHARSAKGRRAALRCADFAKKSKVGKHPCQDSRLKGSHGRLRGRSPGLIRTEPIGCSRSGKRR